MSGIFVTFEGVEGAGKTTQIQLCDRWLQSLGCKVITTREPGGTELGKGIRQLFLGGGDVCDRAELMLLMADRAQHVDAFIKPHLEQGYVILCDRHSDSTFAYQGYGRGIDLDLIAALNQVATGGLKPDLTLWLDLDVRVGLARAKKVSAQISAVGDRMEQQALEFHQRVEHGFRELADKEPDRIKRIDGDRDNDEVFKQIKDYLEPLLYSDK